VNLGAFWWGSDLRGTARLRGNDYVLGSESTEDGADGVADFEGIVMLPDFTDSDTVSVSAPFTFSGQLTPQTTFREARLCAQSGRARRGIRPRDVRFGAAHIRHPPCSTGRRCITTPEADLYPARCSAVRGGAGRRTRPPQ
jgi:hypothetical protein